MNTLKLSTTALAAAVALAACGGGSSGGGAPAVETRTFESSLINGVKYATPTQSGITGVDCAVVQPGCFDVLPGEQVTFTIGNLVLPPVTAVAGQNRITAVDVAKAIDPDQGVAGLPARAIVAYLDALDDGTAEDVDGKRVFQVKPIMVGAPEVQLSDLLADVDDVAELETALEESLEDAGEMNPDVNTDASLETDLAEDELGFMDGLQPLGFFTEAEIAAAMPFSVSELADSVHSVSFTEDGSPAYLGVRFKDDGVLEIAETQNDVQPEEALVLAAQWNVVGGVVALNDTIDGMDNNPVDNEDCLVSAKSASSITLTCREYEDDAEEVSIENFDESTIVLTRVDDLKGILVAGSQWNMIFEARQEETGTLNFVADDTFAGTNTETDSDDPGEPTPTTFSGNYEVDGLEVTLNVTLDDGEMVTDTKFACRFAGFTQNAQTVEDLGLRCQFSSPEEQNDPPEDVLLTQRAGVDPLPNTVFNSTESVGKELQAK